MEKCIIIKGGSYNIGCAVLGERMEGVLDVRPSLWIDGRTGNYANAIIIGGNQRLFAQIGTGCLLAY